MVGVSQVLDHLGSEMSQPKEQAGHAPLRCRLAYQEDIENSMILILLFLQVWHINLFLMLNFVLEKASTRVEPHYLDVWVPTHLAKEEVTKKLVSTILYSYAYHLLYMC
jgi:hypothetical protein